VKNTRRAEAAERLRITLELFQSGLEIERQNLRRSFPEASEEELSACLNDWLQRRPGAEHGDCSGRPIDWAAEPS
jgi:hypothetical protein